jgi:hypothetical protein
MISFTLMSMEESPRMAGKLLTTIVSDMATH